MTRSEALRKYATRMHRNPPGPGAIRMQFTDIPAAAGMVVTVTADTTQDLALVEVTTPGGARVGRARWRSTPQEWDVSVFHEAARALLADIVAAVERERV